MLQGGSQRNGKEVKERERINYDRETIGQMKKKN